MKGLKRILLLHVSPSSTQPAELAVHQTSEHKHCVEHVAFHYGGNKALGAPHRTIFVIEEEPQRMKDAVKRLEQKGGKWVYD